MNPGWKTLAALGGLTLVAPIGLGCGHTRRADDVPVAKSESEPREKTPKRSAAERGDVATESHRKAAAASPPKADAESSKDGPSLATGPEGLLADGAAEKIQERLRERDLLKGDVSSGHWDEPTRAAVRTFQRDNGLPATGMPDDVTIGKLGLKPADVFRSTKK
jgi:hypothetical protein